MGGGSFQLWCGAMITGSVVVSFWINCIITDGSHSKYESCTFFLSSGTTVTYLYNKLLLPSIHFDSLIDVT